MTTTGAAQASGLTQDQAAAFAHSLVTAGYGCTCQGDDAGAWTVTAWSAAGGIDCAEAAKIARANAVTATANQVTFK